MIPDAWSLVAATAGRGLLPGHSALVIGHSPFFPPSSGLVIATWSLLISSFLPSVLSPPPLPNNQSPIPSSSDLRFLRYLPVQTGHSVLVIGHFILLTAHFLCPQITLMGLGVSRKRTQTGSTGSGSCPSCSSRPLFRTSEPLVPTVRNDLTPSRRVRKEFQPRMNTDGHEGVIRAGRPADNNNASRKLSS